MPRRQPAEVIVITGATDGLGKSLATTLANDPNVTLILHGRSTDRLDDLAAQLAGKPARVRTVCADLADMAQVRHVADRIADITHYLSVLVNNAGIGGEVESRTRQLTADGHERIFAVNHLAPFALTRYLLPLLDRGAPARVVNVASLSQVPVDLDDPTMRTGYTATRAYGQSKFAMVSTGFHLAGQLDPQRVTVNSLHPGTHLPTKMLFASGAHSIDTLDSGRDATLNLVRNPAVAGLTGHFFDRTRPGPAHPDTYQHDTQQAIVEMSSAALHSPEP